MPRRAAKSRGTDRMPIPNLKRQPRSPRIKKCEKVMFHEAPPKPDGLRPRSDPFQRLPNIAIELIISHMPNLTTETIRRVSRSWRYHSESFNADTAIACRYPDAVVPVLSSTKFANVVFRRLLHGQGSRGTNLAQTSCIISDIVAWHIRIGILLMDILMAKST